MSKTIANTLEFIKHVKHELTASYDALENKTRTILTETDGLSNYDRSHLEWGITHMHTSLMEFIRDLDRHAVVLEQEQKRASK
jgi:hypothetical protein